jgi:hypothetical protein
MTIRKCWMMGYSLVLGSCVNGMLGIDRVSS